MRKSWLFIGVAAVTSAAIGFGSLARAEETKLPEKAIEQRFEELDQEVQILKRNRELEQEAAAKAKKANPVVKFNSTGYSSRTGGFALESADGQHVLRLRGLVQVDHRAYVEGANDVRNRSDQRAGDLDADGFHDASDSWLLRRLRPIFEGTMFGKYDFRIRPEFAVGRINLRDGYIDARFDPSFKIRVGKFKSFVGLERLHSGGEIKMMERSYVTSLVPNRDLGIAVHGDVLGNTLNYAFGLVNGVSDGGNISTGPEFDGHKEFTGRLFATPFVNDASVLSGLGFGAAATYTNQDGERNLNFTDTSAADDTRNGLPSYRTEGQIPFFRYSSAAVADGSRIRVSPQAYYYVGSFGIMTEYARVIQDVSLTTGGSPPAGGPGSDTVFIPGSGKPLHHQAWNVTLSYFLTGETAAFRGVKPIENFEFGKGWGAWEVVGRYHELALDEDTFMNPAGTAFTGGYADLSTSPKRARSWGVGVNWWLNPIVKVALNYEETSFDGGAGDGVAPIDAAGTNVQDRPDERAVLTRLQLGF
ncbi:MAG: OprO/OprP family phosphate-selective porin [Nitrospira sp.]|nr:OprO/OprP family phosphate-selective porin [Nitrospira sp.]